MDYRPMSFSLCIPTWGYEKTHTMKNLIISLHTRDIHVHVTYVCFKCLTDDVLHAMNAAFDSLADIFRSLFLLLGGPSRKKSTEQW